MKILSSNSMEIPFEPGFFCEMTDSRHLMNCPKDLASRLASDGYLYLTQALDPNLVLDIREKYFRQFPSSFLRPGTSPRQGIYSGRPPSQLPRHGLKGHPAYEFVRTDVFHQFATDPRLFRLAESLIGPSAQQLRRRPLRHFFGDQKTASRAHVDSSYLEAHSDETITIWLPLGDCPLEAGGLVYLEGSRSIDLPELKRSMASITDRVWDSRPITHDLKHLSEQTGLRWLWANFRAGDLVIHASWTVHASLDSQTDYMRLSVDLRFIGPDTPMDPRWADDWSADDGN